MEPLTFKGREGSGKPGGRCAYVDAALNPRYDWQKFELYYRVWGRKLYDPDANAEVWRRWLRSEFGGGAMATEKAVANASRILPLLTSAHLPSASNHSFWPEIYTNMPIVPGSEPSPYSDTPEPKCFATVSPLDPQTFSTVDEHAADLLAGSGELEVHADRSGAMDGGLCGGSERRTCPGAQERGAGQISEFPQDGGGCSDPGGAGAILRGEIAQWRFVLNFCAIGGSAGGCIGARSVQARPGSLEHHGGTSGVCLSQRHCVWKHADAPGALERPARSH